MYSNFSNNFGNVTRVVSSDTDIGHVLNSPNVNMSEGSSSPVLSSNSGSRTRSSSGFWSSFSTALFQVDRDQEGSRSTTNFPQLDQRMATSPTYSTSDSIAQLARSDSQLTGNTLQSTTLSSLFYVNGSEPISISSHHSGKGI